MSQLFDNKIKNSNREPEKVIKIDYNQDKMMDGFIKTQPFSILWMLSALFFALTALTPEWIQADLTSNPKKLSFDHLEGNTLFFKNEDDPSKPKKAFTPPLFDLTYIGSLTSAEEAEPYFLLSGKSCQDCPEDRHIYIFRPSYPKPSAFVYPGKIIDPKAKTLLLESRAFFGKCLKNRKELLVVFQREKVDRRSSLQSSVLVVEPSKTFLSETLIEKHLPALTQTLHWVRKKQ